MNSYYPSIMESKKESENDEEEEFSEFQDKEDEEFTSLVNHHNDYLHEEDLEMQATGRGGYSKRADASTYLPYHNAKDILGSKKSAEIPENALMNQNVYRMHKLNIF